MDGPFSGGIGFISPASGPNGYDLGSLPSNRMEYLMITTLTILALIAELATMVLLIAVGVWLYRRLKTPVLLWVGCYYLLGLIARTVLPRLTKVLVGESHSPVKWTGETLTTITLVSTILDRAAWALVILMVFSEAVYLILNSQNAVNSMPPMVGKVQRHTTALGGVLVSIALFNFVSSAILWMLYPSWG
jgi:hypothetical protein